MIEDGIHSILRYLVKEMSVRVSTMAEMLDEADTKEDPSMSEKRTRETMRKAMHILDCMDALGPRVAELCEKKKQD